MVMARAVWALVLAAVAAPNATQMEQAVRKLRGKFAAVASSKSPLANQAAVIVQDADAALAVKPASASLFEHVLEEQKQFLENITARQHELSKLDQLEGRCRDLETKLLRIGKDATKLIPKSTGAFRVEGVEMLENITRAIKFEGSTLARFRLLHGAMVGAQSWFLHLEKEQVQDARELNVEGSTLLYELLRQRKNLPIKTQEAILKRKTFRDLDITMELVKNLRQDAPLVEQLEELLKKKGLFEEVTSRHTKKFTDNPMKAKVVSSRMGNSAKAIVANMEKAAGILRKQGPIGKEVADKLTTELAKVHLKDKDIQGQLAALDEVQKKIPVWMKEVQKEQR
mmetsp:Transcript_46929/g.102021  ORF Transcript_46929/g.102021 Transcript_46929/m.102021 type:complete len:341 (-) Transcript_46929:139-1161(-)